MKRALVALFMVAGLASCSRDITSHSLPGEVNTAFHARYPNARKVKWERERNGRVYEAKFKDAGRHWEAKFRNDGTFVKEDRI